MPVYPSGSPLVVNGIEADIQDGVAVDTIFCLFDYLPAPDIVNTSAATFGAAKEVPVAV